MQTIDNNQGQQQEEIILSAFSLCNTKMLLSYANVALFMMILIYKCHFFIFVVCSLTDISNFFKRTNR